MSMAKVGGLAALSRRVMKSRALITARGGGGGPMTYRVPDTEPLAEEDELTWHDGTVNPEPCLDNWAPTIGKYEGLAMWAGAMGFFYGVYKLASFMDKSKDSPYSPKEFPYGDLKDELAGAHGAAWAVRDGKK